jgi:hypothetical protein
MRWDVVCYKFTEGSVENTALVFSVEYCPNFSTLKMEAAGASGITNRLSRIASLELVIFIDTSVKITNPVTSILQVVHLSIHEAEGLCSYFLTL